MEKKKKKFKKKCRSTPVKISPTISHHRSEFKFLIQGFGTNLGDLIAFKGLFVCGLEYYPATLRQSGTLLRNNQILSRPALFRTTAVPCRSSGASLS